MGLHDAVVCRLALLVCVLVVVGGGNRVEEAVQNESMAVAD
jgi:hypothetical protein